MNLAGYDPFDHLRQALFWEPDDMVVPLSAYFDASGTGLELPVWAIGGWIATVDQWNQFNKEWRSMLDDAPFRPCVKRKDRIFHAAALESQIGIYEGWTKDEQQVFQDRAYSIIESLQLIPISTALIKSDYEAQKMRFAQFPQGHGGNYFLHSFYDALKNVHVCRYSLGWETNCHFAFERGQLGDGEVQNALTRIASNPREKEFHGLRDWTFAGKELLPLQAADLWAYEAYKHMVNRIVSGPVRKVRYPWERLYRSKFENYQTYWDRENLAALLAEYKRLDAEGKLREEPD